jgi:predicted O-methyltransferase YrrM
MNAATLTARQRFILVTKIFKHMLGMPFSFNEREFLYMKNNYFLRLPVDRINLLSNLFNKDAEEIRAYVGEAEAIAIDEWNGVCPDNGTKIGNPMGKTDRITLYTVIRICKPHVAVETGCAAGASATYMLSAMVKNGRGTLYSIDSAADRSHLGCLVPVAFRDRIKLRYGNSLMLIPEIAGEAGTIDFFHHDSLHTYAHMKAEYELFYRHMAKSGGVICSHDILMSNAWVHFLKRHRLKNWGRVKNLGVCRVGISAGSGNHQ